MDPDLTSLHARAAAPCPICDKPQTVEYRPFCSKRCADIDLSRWLHGVYAIPSQHDLNEDETQQVDALPDRTAEDERRGGKE